MSLSLPVQLVVKGTAPINIPPLKSVLCPETHGAMVVCPRIQKHGELYHTNVFKQWRTNNATFLGIFLLKKGVLGVQVSPALSQKE